jgi:hypothetical protein
MAQSTWLPRHWQVVLVTTAGAFVHDRLGPLRRGARALVARRGAGGAGRRRGLPHPHLPGAAPAAFCGSPSSSILGDVPDLASFHDAWAFTGAVALAAGAVTLLTRTVRA